MVIRSRLIRTLRAERMWSAGIYDEGRRGWLFPDDGETGAGQAFSEQGPKIFKPDDWNHVRVEAVGDSIKTWLNGTPCAVLKDSMTPRGFIALQVHGIGKAVGKNGTQVRWRNLKLTDLDAGPNTLSDAEKAAGWRCCGMARPPTAGAARNRKSFPAKGWEIKDGVAPCCLRRRGIRGGRRHHHQGALLQFELTLDFKITAGANSGIKYFCQPNLDPITGTGAKATTGSAIGLEFQILDDARHPDAKAGRDGNRTIGSLYDLMTAAAAKQPSPIGEWNTRAHRGQRPARRALAERPEGARIRARLDGVPRRWRRANTRTSPVSANGPTATSCFRITATGFLPQHQDPRTRRP
jgi:hypothetical protein